MTRDLTTGSIWKHIFYLAVPSFLCVAIQQIYSLVDTVIVGRILGESQLAGVGATGGLFFMIVFFCTGSCNGFGIPVAQEFGRKDYAKMRRFFANSVWLSIVLCVLVVAITSILCTSFLNWMRTPTEIYNYSYDYILLIFFGLPFTFFYNLLASVIRGLGDTRTPLAALIISSVVNIGLDYALMAVIPMGVAGAAIATVISQGVAGLFCLIILIKRFEIVKPVKADMSIDMSCIRKLSAIGIPMGLQCSITGIGIVVAQTAVNALGAAAVTGMTVSQKIVSLLNSPIDGIAQILSAFAGQNLGAGKLDRVKEGLWKATLAGSLWTLITIPIVLLFGKSFVYMFLQNPGEDVIQYAFTAMMWVVTFGILLTIVNTFRFTIQGLGYSTFAMLAGIMEMFGRAFSGLVLAPVIGFTGAAMGNALAWVLADLFLVPAFFWCYKLCKKKQV